MAASFGKFTFPAPLTPWTANKTLKETKTNNKMLGRLSTKVTAWRNTTHATHQHLRSLVLTLKLLFSKHNPRPWGWQQLPHLRWSISHYTSLPLKCHREGVERLGRWCQGIWGTSLSESPPLHRSKLLVDKWGYLGASIMVINDADVERHLRTAPCSIVLLPVSNGAPQLQGFKTSLGCLTTETK